MWTWFDKLCGFAISNSRVVRDAWAPFLVWCFIAFMVAWFAQGWLFQYRLENSRSSVETLSMRMNSLQGENQDLRVKLAEVAKSVTPAPAPPVSATPGREPDGLYQYGVLSAHAEGATINRSRSLAMFQGVRATGNFDFAASMEYGQYLLSGCSGSYAGGMKSFGAVVSALFVNVSCHIAGIHP